MACDVCGGGGIVRNKIGLEVECFKCKRASIAMICKCTHEIKVFLKEGKKKFKHARIVRGLELTTRSCQEGDCGCLTPEQEEER